MKKTIVLALTMLSMTACTTKNSGGPAAPQATPAPTSLKMGGTVALMMQLLMPKAQAMAVMLPTFSAQVGDLPDTSGQTCAADRCIFLVDTGTSDASGDASLSTDATIVAVAPIVDGKFSFDLALTSSPELTKESKSGHVGEIYRLVVRNWDQTNQTLAAEAATDRSFVVSADDLQHADLLALKVTAQTSLNSNRRQLMLQKDASVKEDSSLIDALAALFKTASESTSDFCMRIIAELLNGATKYQGILADNSSSVDATSYASDSSVLSLTAENAAMPISAITDGNVAYPRLMEIDSAATQAKSNLAAYDAIHGTATNTAIQISSDISAYQNKKQLVANSVANGDTSSDQYNSEVSDQAQAKATVMTELSAFVSLCPVLRNHTRLDNAVTNLQNIAAQVKASSVTVEDEDGNSVQDTRIQPLLTSIGSPNISSFIADDQARLRCSDYEYSRDLSASVEAKTQVTGQVSGSDDEGAL